MEATNADPLPAHNQSEELLCYSDREAAAHNAHMGTSSAASLHWLLVRLFANKPAAAVAASIFIARTLFESASFILLQQR